MIKVGIIGAAGYTGGELLRILTYHPEVEIVWAVSRSNAGNHFYDVHADLFGDTDKVFVEKPGEKADVVFFCTSHGETGKLLAEYNFDKDVKIIDLTNEFRVNNTEFVYGLPEINREQIKKATKIANPGCFATCIQLALVPALKAGIIKSDINVSAITGSTGAGVKLSATSHFSWRNNNMSVYKAFTHQHLAEINQTKDLLDPKLQRPIHFIPYRGDFSRGIIASVYFTCDKSQEEVEKIYSEYYQNEPFTHYYNGNLYLKQVVNTNKCIVSVKKEGDQVLVQSVIDNLVKGAVGQATENMNLMFGLDEKCGLKLKPSAF
ncbi:MAG: N-acetyl-gamma-glutamyl-phosphate reductase [Bacteroidales bacterium]|nr:N-acetyl-gamma-glutamyl-phosphate reductase [Bacteroidales bacterium]